MDDTPHTQSGTCVGSHEASGGERAGQDDDADGRKRSITCLALLECLAAAVHAVGPEAKESIRAEEARAAHASRGEAGGKVAWCAMRNILSNVKS